MSSTVTQEAFYEALQEHLHKQNVGKGAEYDREDYIEFHKNRYWLSYRHILPLLQPGVKVLELGEPGPFTYVLGKFHPKLQLAYAEEDLRYGISFGENTFDLVLNMEVIEHIKDLNEAPMDWVDMSGLKNFIREIQRVLKPNGKMFISTPNSLSYNNMNLFFNQEAAWMWYGHFKEFTVPDLCRHIADGGLKIDMVKTLNVWPQRYEHRYTQLIILIDRIKKWLRFKSMKNHWRGDSIFMICSK
ncbi:MAG: class I SAM-dependent methyltransferase [Flavobacteriales bacterium]